MLRKIFFILITTIILGITGYFTFLYYATYSEGVRSGELIKISSKGMIFKTYEGELSQGISGAKIFTFSVSDLYRTIQNFSLVGGYKIFCNRSTKRKITTS
jgi:hypothetical protein